MLAWGCNAKVHVPPRFKNSGKHKLTYKHATAMEVLVSCQRFQNSTMHLCVALCGFVNVAGHLRSDRIMMSASGHARVYDAHLQAAW